jgi:hypothetical protein
MINSESISLRMDWSYMEGAFLASMALFLFSYCTGAVLLALFYVKKITKARLAPVASPLDGSAPTHLAPKL